MSRVRSTASVLAVLLLTPGLLGLAAAANWQPDDGDWAVYRRDVNHTGATAAKGAFSLSLADLRIKWQRADDPGYWVPPVAADLDGDGVAEVVATVGNASADPNNAQNPVSVQSGLNVINGATGAIKWKVAPETGYLDFYSPALGDIDADGKGEIVYIHGQPLTGTSLTNKVVAYEADGTKKWEFSDTNWGSRVPLPLTGVSIGDVDGESAKQEVVFSMLLATVTTTISGGKVNIAGSNPEYRIIALNGEGSTASKSWEKVFTGKATGSNVALADLDGDGVLDVVHGAGVKSGTLLETSAARITVTADFEDNKVRAWRGGTSAVEHFNFAATGFFPGELGTAPAIADLDGDGSLEIVQPLWIRNVPPGPGETSTLLVLNQDGTEKWRRTVNAALAALIAQPPPAIADLDGDGKKDIIVQTTNGAAADRYRLIAFDHLGNVKWRGPDIGREMTGVPAVGDITGDGKPEVLSVFGTTIGLNQTQTLLVFNGQTGAEIMRKTFDVGATIGGPLLVDLDGDDDGRLEIVLNTGFWGSPGKLIALEPELPDLRLTGLTFSAAEHLHGVAETVSATVTNIGSRAANGALVRFTEDGASLHEATLTLAPGASQVVQFTWTPAHVGSRTIAAEADPGKAIPEFAENNNREARAIQVRAPDLRPGANDPVFSDSTPGVGDTITVSATVTNAGGKDASNVLVRFLDGSDVFHELTLASLAKGASQQVSASLLVEGEFDRHVAVVADPLDAIVEENEANNRASKLLDVIFIAPDLTAGAIGFSNPTPGGDEVIQVSVPVSNIGSKDAGPFVVRFLDEGTAFAEATLASLAEGATTTVTRDLLVVGEFPHTIEVVVDPDNELNEEREDNNVASRVLQVLAPDLSIVPADIAVSDRNPDESDTLTITATVRNVGTGGKVPRDVLVTLLDGATTVDSDVIASLPAGSSAAANLAYTITGLGPRTLTVRVDPLDAVNELNEANNAADLRVVVGKVDVTVTMSRAAYPFMTQADGVAGLKFRSTGKPVANHEFPLLIEYVIGTSTGVPSDQLVGAAGALLARLGGFSKHHVQLCSLDKCVEVDADLEGSATQLLGGGGSSGSSGELRIRTFTLDARTNNQGQAAFTVPYNGFTAFDSAEGLVGAEACLHGFDDVFALANTVTLPVPVRPCTVQLSSLPALPGVGNLPGQYRATALVDWHGFGFRGHANWVHV